MEPVGFEPTTFRLQGECSPNWAMSPWFLFSLIQLPIICSQHMITSSSTRLSGNRTKETDKVNYYGNNLFIHYKAHFLETSSVFYNFFQIVGNDLAGFEPTYSNYYGALSCWATNRSVAIICGQHMIDFCYCRSQNSLQPERLRRVLPPLYPPWQGGDSAVCPRRHIDYLHTL